MSTGDRLRTVPAYSILYFVKNNEKLGFILLHQLFDEFNIQGAPECYRSAYDDPNTFVIRFKDSTLPFEKDNLLDHLKNNFDWTNLLNHIQPIGGIDLIGVISVGLESKELDFIVDELREIPPVLYKYIDSDLAKIDGFFTENTIYLAAPDQFNDPFDCNLSPESVDFFKDKRMTCFTPNDRHPLMFSHYAEQHKGLCIGFDIDKLVKLVELSTRNIEVDFRKVFYHKTPPNYTMTKQKALIATCKQREWFYEREYRMFIREGATPTSQAKHKFPPEAIKEIIFGCKMLPEKRSEIYKKAKHLNVVFFESTPSESEFEFEKYELKFKNGAFVRA